MVMAVLASSMVAVLATSMVVIQVSGAVEQGSSRQETRAVLAAEAGLSKSYIALQANKNGALGSANSPVALAGGAVFVETQTFGPTHKLLRVTSTARVGNSTASAELVLKDNVDTLFVYGAFGDTDLDLTAQTKVDSYNSTLGSYASQEVNGSGSNAWANDEGHIGSNGNIAVGVTSLVMGDASPGVTGSLTVTGSATVSGATANLTTPVSFPAINVPPIASVGNTTFSSDTTLPAGNYHYGSTVINNNRTLTLTGPATIVFDSFEMKSSSQFLIDSTNGPVDIYVMDSFVMNSNTLFAANNRDPRAVRLNMLSDNILDPAVVIVLDTLTLASNAKFFGTMYAPDAFIDVSSNFEIYGSVVAEKVRLASNSRVHYDEALGQVLAPGSARYSRVSWRALH